MVENGLSAASITDNLDTCYIGQRVIYYPSLTSTMDVARKEAQRGAVEGTVVIADEQTGGKGRKKRVWLTTRGNIALSIILYPQIPDLPYLIMVASLAVASSIEAVTGLKTQIKWPNDILINGKKVCGILIESDIRRDKVAHAVIGIGINVRLNLSEYPDLLSSATSLSDESGIGVSRVDVICYLLKEIERLYNNLPAGESIYKEWRDRLTMLGKRIQIKSGNNLLEGIAESVDNDGSLRLRHPDGSLTKIIAGDVTLRD